MKTSKSPRPKGVALIIVLTFLTLIAVFVIGFFMAASSELSAASSYAASVSTQELQDTATNVVIGQIREATTRPGEVWASQPGMLRTYRTNLPASFYKLYSSPRMVIEGDGNDGEPSASTYSPYTDIDDLPTGANGWNHKPALFVNLNDPVRVPIRGSEKGTSGTYKTDFEYRYPIVDPAAFYQRSQDDPDIGNFTSATADKQLIEGAELIRDSTDDSDSASDGTEKLTNLTRMPVRWLYILKDGTVTAPTDSDDDGKTAVWKPGKLKYGIPTPTNPIVGRVAFWTDDETCKVNVNTAGGFSSYKIGSTGKTDDTYCGSYWDAPRFSTAFDKGVVDTNSGAVSTANMSLALSQPVRNEFQRYGGHPATTSLGLVFKNILTSDQLYAIAPRLNGGGSEGGTKRLISDKGDTAITLKKDRLYSSVDELLFAAPADSETSATRTQASTKLSAPDLSPELIRRLRFFLTASNRAPDLNVFGRPRITLWPFWPIYDPSSHNTAATYTSKGGGTKFPRAYFRNLVNANATERLLSFCSTLGPRDNEQYVRPYFFERSNPYSPTEDATIPRNRQLLSYLNGMFSSPIPGTEGKSGKGATFADKYPGETSDSGDSTNGDIKQIGAEIFDYIRSANLRDASDVKYAPEGMVIPSTATEFGSVPGMGRVPTISEASIVFYHAGYLCYQTDTKGAKVLYRPTSRKEFREKFNGASGSPSAAGSGYLGRFMKAFVMFENFSPMEGYAAETSFDFTRDAVGRGLYFTHEISGGLSGFSVRSKTAAAWQNLKLPSTGTNRFWSVPGSFNGRTVGGQEGFQHMLFYGTLTSPPASDPGTASAAYFYPFQSGGDFTPPPPELLIDPATGKQFPSGPTSNFNGDQGAYIPKQDDTFDFQGGSATVKVTFAGTLLRTVKIDFPSSSGSWPVPTDNIWDEHGGFNREGSAVVGSGEAGWTQDVNGEGKSNMFKLGDRLSWSRKLSSEPWTVDGRYYGARSHQILQPGDTIRSLVPANPNTKNSTAKLQPMGDPRALALAAKADGTSDYLQPHPDYLKPVRHAQCLRMSTGIPFMSGTALDADTAAANPNQAANTKKIDTYFGSIIEGLKYSASTYAPDVPAGVTKVVRSDGLAPDFDTGLAGAPDGGFANKSDEGAGSWRYFEPNGNRWVYVLPYYYGGNIPGLDLFFSPNRQMPSAVQFGSLLAGRTKHWQTLAFSPMAAGSPHPGNSVEPKDHYLLDFFNMPVVEPYAISEPLSTAGRVNLNYAMAPFSHIRRSTAMRAALHPLRVTAVPNKESARYKGATMITDTSYRYPVNRDETLKAFDSMFFGKKSGRPELFRTASQVCEMFLYPKLASTDATKMGVDPKYSADEKYIRKMWDNCTLTGDNLREKPYNDLYPRVTTKSNTYTVHMWVQTLKKRLPPGASKAEATEASRRWSETTDRVVGEYRGSTTIERYIDPDDRRFNPAHIETARLNDAVDPDKDSLESMYRFRVIESRRFAP